MYLKEFLQQILFLLFFVFIGGTAEGLDRKWERESNRERESGGAGLYIAVKNELTVSKNVTEAKNSQKLLGIPGLLFWSFLTSFR